MSQELKTELNYLETYKLKRASQIDMIESTR